MVVDITGGAWPGGRSWYTALWMAQDWSRSVTTTGPVKTFVYSELLTFVLVHSQSVYTKVLITLNQKKFTLYTFIVITTTSCMPQRHRATTIALCSISSSFETVSSLFPATSVLSSSSSPMTSSSSRTSPSSVSRSVKSPSVLSSAEVESVCSHASPLVFAQVAFDSDCAQMKLGSV